MRSLCYLVVLVVLAAAGPAIAAAPSIHAAGDPGKAALEEARRAEAANRSDEAITALKRAYELTGETDLLFRLGELTHKISQDVPAIRFYRAYLTRDPRGKHRVAAERQVQLLEARETASARPREGVGVAAKAPIAVVPATTKAPAGGAPAATTSPPPFVGGTMTSASLTNASGPPGATPIATGGMGRPAFAPASGAPPATAVGPTAGGPIPTGARATPPGQTTLALAPVPGQGDPLAPHVDLRSEPSQPVTPTAEPPLPRWLPWAGVAATLALGAGAAVAGLSASHRYDDLRNSCGQTPAGCSTAQVDQVRSRARAATLLWVGAGVMAAGTGVALYVNTREAGFSGIWRF